MRACIDTGTAVAAGMILHKTGIGDVSNQLAIVVEDIVKRVIVFLDIVAAGLVVSVGQSIIGIQ